MRWIRMCEKAVKSMVETCKHIKNGLLSYFSFVFNSPPSYCNLTQGSSRMCHVSPSIHEDDVGFASKAQTLPVADPKRVCSAMKRWEIECKSCTVFKKEIKGYINFLSSFFFNFFCVEILLENYLFFRIVLDL